MDGNNILNFLKHRYITLIQDAEDPEFKSKCVRRSKLSYMLTSPTVYQIKNQP